MGGAAQAALGLTLMVCPVSGVAATTTPIPIEVEMEPGAVSCAPGDERFDRGFRTGLREEQLRVMDTAGGGHTLANAFCLASERPNERPLRVRVRIRCDAGANYDYVRPTRDAISRADHWLIHVAVPFRAKRLAPARWQRMSLWARSDRESYCEDIGRVIALCVLEALNHESGRIRREAQLVLGPGVTRDAKYSGEEGAWPALVSSLAEVGVLPTLVRSVAGELEGQYVIPAAGFWLTVLVIAFAVVRFAQRVRMAFASRLRPPWVSRTT
jgi:hypothetical protein